MITFAKIGQLFALIDASIPKTDAAQLIKSGLNIVYLIVGMVAVIMIILAGYQYITSNGDSGKAQSAMRTILGAAIGIVVAASAFAITSFVFGRVQG